MIPLLPTEEFKRRNTHTVSCLAPIAGAIIAMQHSTNSTQPPSTKPKDANFQDPTEHQDPQPSLASRILCIPASRPLTTPTSLERIYLLFNHIRYSNLAQFRRDVESFFHQPSLKLKHIPDPTDPNSIHYAIICVITQLLVLGFNHRIRKGQWRRGAPSELELTVRSAVYRCPYVQELETMPEWVDRVPMLEKRVVVRVDGKMPWGREVCKRGVQLGLVMWDMSNLFLGEK
jgi:hypothetical protein